MTWREGDYEGGPLGMWIRPADPESPPSGGISSTVLRSIDFRKAKAKLVDDLARNPEGWRGHLKKAKQASSAARVERLRHEMAGGVNRPSYLALLASDYIHRVQDGQHKPVEHLAEDLGKPLQTVRGHLWQSRKRGFLLGSPGRKGGVLSPEAMAVIQNLPKQPTSLIDADPPAGMEERDDR